MNKIFFKTSLFFVCLICYYFFFWEEKFGLNLFIFNTLLMAFIYFDLKIENKISKMFLFLLFSNLIAATSVLIQNTALSKWVYFISLFMLVGFTVKPSLALVHQLLGQFLLRFLKAIKQLLIPINVVFDIFMKEVVNKNKYLAKLKITIIPMMILGIFYVIFNIANPIFKEINAVFFNEIALFFKNLPDFSFGRLLFLLGGYYLLVSIFYKETIVDDEPQNPDEYITKNEENIDNNHFQTGQLTIFLVNSLLLVINFIDVKYLWFIDATSKNENLSSLVHTGTYMLIFSILLSMTIILLFFKNELNFHAKIKQLRVLSYFWIFQNVVLVISVLIRNANYIEQYGLTYKRIGIMVFLSLTIVGLVSLVLKINQIRSFYYLFKTNTWAWYVALILFACIDFDRLVVEYNLKNNGKKAFDLAYAEQLSSRTAPSVVAFFQKESKGDLLLQHNFQSNIYNYHQELERYSWLSWNKADSNFKRTQR